MVGARARAVQPRAVQPPGNQLKRTDDSPFLMSVPKQKLAGRQRLRYHRPAELDRFLDLDVLEERKLSRSKCKPDHQASASPSTLKILAAQSFKIVDILLLLLDSVVFELRFRLGVYMRVRGYWE